MFLSMAGLYYDAGKHKHGKEQLQLPLPPRHVQTNPGGHRSRSDSQLEVHVELT